MKFLQNPTGAAALGGGLSAATQIALKMAIKLDSTKPASEQKAKLFLYRHAGLVGFLLSAAVAAALYFTKNKKGAVAVLVGGGAASLPGIIDGVQKALAQKKFEEGQKSLPADQVQSYNVAMGVPSMQARSNFGASGQVELFGPAQGQVDLYGPTANMRAFGGASF